MTLEGLSMGDSTEYDRAYYQANRDKRRAQGRAWYQANAEQVRAKAGAYYQANLEKSRQDRRAWNAANRDRTKARRLRHYHGLTPEGLAEIFAAQGGRCYLCADPLNPDKAFLDHDHRCCPDGYSCATCRRGLACMNCNPLIGFAGDDPDRLRRIADALEPVILAVTQRLATRPQPVALFEIEEIPMAVQRVQLPNSAQLTGDESMAATNTITDKAGTMSLPGSPSESTTGKDVGQPVPEIPAARLPLTPTAGEHGGVGLPSAPGQSSGGFTTGVQPGGNQGHGNPGAGSSGPDAWKPTVSSS